MKGIICAGIIAACAASTAIWAKSDQRSEKLFSLNSTYVEICNSWRYDYETNSYTCRYTQRINIYQTRDVDRLLNQLSTKIQRLEQRVQDLENPE